MQCREVRELADSFLAEELLTETNHEILTHLENCPGCREELERRRDLRASLRAAVNRAGDLQAGPEFLSRLHDTLRAQAHPVRRSRAALIPGWWPVAAALLLAAVVGGIWGRDWSGLSALARAAVGDHKNCALTFALAEKPVPLRDVGGAEDVLYRALERVPANEIATPVGVARVLERHVCVYQGQRFVHVVMAYQGERVSLLVPAAVRSSLAGTAAAVRELHLAGATSIDGLPLISFQTARRVVFFVGAVSPADLTTLAETISGPLFREIASA